MGRDRCNGADASWWFDPGSEDDLTSIIQGAAVLVLVTTARLMQEPLSGFDGNRQVFGTNLDLRNG